MLTIFIRVAILYGVSVLAMRLMGKRQVGQLQPYELVLALMVAEIAASPMEDMDAPMFHGLVPILGLLALHGVCTALALKCMPARRMLYGVPGIVIRNGIVDYNKMKHMGYTMTDLMEDMRGQGYEDIAKVHTAILETNGKLSVFPKAMYAPVTAEDMQLKVQEKGMPFPLVVDGRVQKQHLKECGHDERWLDMQLEKMGIRRKKNILLASLAGDGQLFVQEKTFAQPRLFKTGGEE